MADTIDNVELARLLADEERHAVSFRESTLADEQEAAILAYEAQPYGDEEEGRSQVVAPVVAEVVDYMTISILRTCVSGDRVVEFEANSEEQVQAAEEATEAVNYAFMRQQDGYKVLTDWVQSGLIEKIGIVKTARVVEEKKRKEQIVVSEDELGFLMETEQVTAADDNGDGTFTVEISKTEKRKRYVDYPIPSEEFLFSARCRHEDDYGYKAHRSRKTLSELVEMGFDRDTVYGLSDHDEITSLDSRSVARWNDETLHDDTDVPGLRKVWLREEYLDIDFDGDGIVELVKVFRVGETILEVEEVEENPFVVFCPFPRAHRMVGNALADKVLDIQRVKTVSLRQTLDGMYLTNNPRMWLPEECITENTIDDLLTVRPGALVRGRGAAGKPEPLYEPFDLQRGLTLLEFLSGECESRTGITRLNQGLDADALNKTATGTALMQYQGQQVEEYIARNFAESMSRLFRKKARLMIDDGEPIMIRIGGRFKEANPRGWAPDMDITIRVGLGSGRKDQRLMYRQQLLEMQKEGFMTGMVNPKQIYANVSGMIRDAALGNPQDFWTDPESPEAQQEAAAKAQQPQQPDPEMVKVQAEMQAKQAEMQMREREGQLKIQLAEQEAAAKLELERQKVAQEADLAQQKFEFEAAMAEKKMMLEAQLAKEQADRQHEVAMKQADVKISQNRPGGQLDE